MYRWPNEAAARARPATCRRWRYGGVRTCLLVQLLTYYCRALSMIAPAPANRDIAHHAPASHLPSWSVSRGSFTNAALVVSFWVSSGK
ncbi:hypothetical protein IF2G_03096 [Cordyceps javanica]|nr:hypothetical protein IF2G_03096 [Cordyceps javanica]